MIYPTPRRIVHSLGFDTKQVPLVKAGFDDIPLLNDWHPGIYMPRSATGDDWSVGQMADILSKRHHPQIPRQILQRPVSLPELWIPPIGSELPRSQTYRFRRLSELWL